MPSLSYPVTEKIRQSEADRTHHCATMPYHVLERIESLLHSPLQNTAETGCGKSTILFSQLSNNHTVFCLDDRHVGNASSVRYFQESKLFRPKNVTCHFGPSQKTLTSFDHKAPYDCVLIDGPHAYPFQDYEYYCFYPHIRKGGLLIIDDVHLASIGRMADILQEDAMWNLIELAGTAAIFRRTDAVTLSPTGDGWWKQGYNTRRLSTDSELFLNDDAKLPSFEERLKPIIPEKPPVSLYRKVRRIGRRVRKLILGR